MITETMSTIGAIVTLIEPMAINAGGKILTNHLCLDGILWNKLRIIYKQSYPTYLYLQIYNNYYHLINIIYQYYHYLIIIIIYNYHVIVIIISIPFYSNVSSKIYLSMWMCVCACACVGVCIRVCVYCVSDTSVSLILGRGV